MKLIIYLNLLNNPLLDSFSNASSSFATSFLKSEIVLLDSLDNLS